jgi:hypothetical protein
MTGHEIESAVSRNDRLWLGLRNGSTKPVPVATDHVIAATGYRVDLQRLRFIDKGLLDCVRTVGAMPFLSTDFESSVPGLYFTGLAAAGSFGPLMRFMYGTEFAAQRISQHIGASVQTT